LNEWLDHAYHTITSHLALTLLHSSLTRLVIAYHSQMHVTVHSTAHIYLINYSSDFFLH